ncbi:hypothetical protein JOM56_011852 [Amanita muscaria]
MTIFGQIAKGSAISAGNALIASVIQNIANKLRTACIDDPCVDVIQASKTWHLGIKLRKDTIKSQRIGAFVKNVLGNPSLCHSNCLSAAAIFMETENVSVEQKLQRVLPKRITKRQEDRKHGF